MKKILFLSALLIAGFANSTEGQFIPYDMKSDHAKQRMADYAVLQSALSSEDKQFLKALAYKYRPKLIEARDRGEREEMEQFRSEQFAEIAENLSSPALQALLATRKEK